MKNNKMEFEDGRTKYITDPCGRYGSTRDQNSGFVIDCAIETVNAIEFMP